MDAYQGFFFFCKKVKPRDKRQETSSMTSTARAKRVGIYMMELHTLFSNPAAVPPAVWYGGGVCVRPMP